ncbi:MAG: type I restriction endonuclease subunit R [Candidatus Methanomethylophilaceae archaeon]|nr:type I restriction endonuclease subunit R [Candidatus Methanomethylophilaceae archaeon]
MIGFIKDTQPREWKRFVSYNSINPERNFLVKFRNACETYGVLEVLRHGFKHRGIDFKVCYFKPESRLNRTSENLYGKNVCEVYRQWHYSKDNKNSVDMVLVLNGIPLFVFELKNQYTGQNVEDAKRQWMYDRDPREPCFQFNRRVLAFFCVDDLEVWMATALKGKDTFFLPFNEGTSGAGNDGGAGNPSNPEGYPVSYLWEKVFQKDSMMDIVRKFIHLERKEVKKIDIDGNVRKTIKETLIFPRYHQLDVVRRLIEDVKHNGPGKNYLVQHSAGSGKSNSIAWIAYRLASLHDDLDKPMFSSVVIITDRKVLDKQLQDTISAFDHTLGTVETIGDNKTSRHLRDALNNGARIIVTTLQKFPVIYEEVDKEEGRNFAVIVDEAHSSQTGTSATKLKVALANPEDALREYAEVEDVELKEIDIEDPLIKEMITQGKHKNLSFFAFTATPKDKTLEIFGTQYEDGTFHPFHIYSMRQAIEEGFILDVLQNYMTYDTCYRLAKTTQDNPDLPSNRAKMIIRRNQSVDPYNISEKSKIIVETFMETTRHKIDGKGKMMVVTSSRLAAVRYQKEIKRYVAENGYDIGVLVAFSGTVLDGDEEWTESKLNIRKDGTTISENQTKSEFHENFDILVVAEKYQTGFDEPLLHTMIVDKKLKGVKAVQTLSRLNRTAPGKNDTFVLDFINKNEDIQEAFQPFYQETMLNEEVNTDLIYQTQKMLRAFNVYDDYDIERFSDEYFAKGVQDSKAMGRMTSILLPVTDRYNQKDENDRYKFRRELRSLKKWYEYISQVVRMFDKELHKEYVFCSYLLKLLPLEPKEDVDLEGKLKLEYYRLQKTFEGSIELTKTKGAYDASTQKGAGCKDKKEPLDEILKKINEKYNGNFTDSDKVVMSNLRDKLINNEKLKGLAISSEPKIFMESLFPKMFEDTAMESYLESTETYESLFQDDAKYNAVMSALGEALYRDWVRKSK